MWFEHIFFLYSIYSIFCPSIVAPGNYYLYIYLRVMSCLVCCFAMKRVTTIQCILFDIIIPPTTTRKISLFNCYYFSLIIFNNFKISNVVSNQMSNEIIRICCFDWMHTAHCTRRIWLWMKECGFYFIRFYYLVGNFVWYPKRAR